MKSRASQVAPHLPVLVGGSVLQLGAWLLLRPDKAGAQWTDGAALGTWIGVEAALAAAIGIVAAKRADIRATIIAGWSLQMLHFGFFGEHYDGTLWGVGLFFQAAFAALAVGIALLTHSAVRRSRGRVST